MWYFILGIVVAWLVFNHMSKKRTSGDSGAVFNVNKHIDEEKIQERQQSFEDFMVYSFVPTALYADKRTTYFQMKDWFVRLDERFSHDSEKQQQVRQDWLTYMYQLDHGATAHYLFMESDNDEASRDHGNDARESAIRVNEIEDRFAAMIGPEAHERLKEIRGKEFGDWMKEQRVWDEQLRAEKEKKSKTETKS